MHSVLACTDYSSSLFRGVIAGGMGSRRFFRSLPPAMIGLTLAATLQEPPGAAAKGFFKDRSLQRMNSNKLKCLMIASGLMFLEVNMFSDTLTVVATSDIYGAGQASLPATLYPGTFPPSDSFTADPNQILKFSSVTGRVGCNFVITNGPDGTCFPGVSTTVTSYGGVSGIDVKDANMFLVGVFQDASAPSGPGPLVLDYNYGIPGSLSTSDASFSPVLDQVFFIGDGLTGTGTGSEQVFHVPTAADRLFLGFADSFDAAPSYYADNVGSLVATFAITTTATPEPAYNCLLTGGLVMGVLLYRRKCRPRGLTDPR